MVRAKVYLREEISAAHRLFLPYESKCKYLHGHNYLVEVWVEGEVLEDGMVMDFSHIKAVIKEYDHMLLNEKIAQPTAENLALEIAGDIVEMAKLKKRKIYNVKVRVWEDRDSYAEVEKVV